MWTDITGASPSLSHLFSHIKAVFPISRQPLGWGTSLPLQWEVSPHLAPGFSLILDTRGYGIVSRLSYLYSKKKILIGCSRWRTYIQRPLTKQRQVYYQILGFQNKYYLHNAKHVTGNLPSWDEGISFSLSKVVWLVSLLVSFSLISLLQAWEFPCHPARV